MSKPLSTSSWRATAEPAACPGLAGVVTGVYLAVALAPCLAGCGLPLSLALGSACLAALPGALRAVPGRRCPLRSLSFDGGGWMARFLDGPPRPARIESATRVVPGLVLCRLTIDDRSFDRWIPRPALPVAEFRRLKVALRCCSRAAAA